MRATILASIAFLSLSAHAFTQSQPTTGAGAPDPNAPSIPLDAPSDETGSEAE